MMWQWIMGSDFRVSLCRAAHDGKIEGMPPGSDLSAFRCARVPELPAPTPPMSGKSCRKNGSA